MDSIQQKVTWFYHKGVVLFIKILLNCSYPKLGKPLHSLVVNPLPRTERIYGDLLT